MGLARSLWSPSLTTVELYALWSVTFYLGTWGMNSLGSQSMVLIQMAANSETCRW